MPFQISIIAPTFKRMDRLPAFLRAAEAMRGAVIEIIICNRPDDDPETAVWLRAERPAHPRWRLVPVREPGLVAALNAGLAIAQGDIIAVFDDDTLPARDWLEVITPHFGDPMSGPSEVGTSCMEQTVRSRHPGRGAPDIAISGEISSAAIISSWESPGPSRF